MHDPYLKDLRCVDIADIYAAHTRISWDEALTDLINQVLNPLKQHDEICVEATSAAGPPSANTWSITRGRSLTCSTSS